MIGITNYGFYIPKYRIKVQDIAAHWGKCADKVELSLKITEKAVAGADEDVLTMGYEAARLAVGNDRQLIKKIGAVFVGSETFPYAVKPTATSLASHLGIEGDYLGYDTQFACKAATGALISAYGLVKAGEVNSALVVASDKANAKPKDALEYSAGSGANAWILGRKGVIAEIVAWHSYTTDTPDFWRRSKAEYPSHGGRFTGAPAYFNHISEAVTRLLVKANKLPDDFAHAVFHMPNGSFPYKVSSNLGFTKAQIEAGYIVPKLGNSYSASALMGLVSIFETAKPGALILFASYGSGAGSDGIIFKVTKEIEKKRQQFRKMLNQKEYIDYSTYAKYMHTS